MRQTTYIAAAMLLTVTTASAQPAAPQPGKEHELLQKNLGERTGQMKVWVQGPDSEPVMIPFKEVNTSIHDGFWVETKFESGPYQGRGMYGYDPKKKKYIGTWTSNMTPHLSVMEGTFDEKASALTMTFQDYDEQTGLLTDMKSVTVAPQDQPETMTMYKKDAKSGKFVKSFVLIYDQASK